MSASKLRTLVQYLTFAEGVAAVWSGLAAVSVGLVVPLVLLPEVVSTMEEGMLLGDHARRALNPWLGHTAGGLAATILVGALFLPMRQEVARMLLISSLVLSLAVGFYTSWALQAVLG
jgi:hypothetical protein